MDIDRTDALAGSIFLATAAMVAADLIGDAPDATAGHLIVEAAIVVGALTGLTVLGRRWLRERGALRGQLADAAAHNAALSAEAVRFRQESKDALAGLSAAIDRQFERWALSPAEREVGLLLLKGLSHKEVADVLDKSERTVRQQALAIYKKGGLAGRAELAAFFLEDLLAPPELTARSPAPPV